LWWETACFDWAVFFVIALHLILLSEFEQQQDGGVPAGLWQTNKFGLALIFHMY